MTIGAGARVKEAIILDRAEVKVIGTQICSCKFSIHFLQEHCCVLHSIVGWDCELEPWSRIEGYPSDPNPNDPYAHVPRESLFKKDGRLNPSITILG